MFWYDIFLPVDQVKNIWEMLIKKKKMNTLPSKLGMHFNARANSYLLTWAAAYVAVELAKWEKMMQAKTS